MPHPMKTASKPPLRVICPGDRVVHIIDIYERAKRGIPLVALARELDVKQNVLNYWFDKAGLPKLNNTGRPRASRPT